MKPSRCLPAEPSPRRHFISRGRVAALALGLGLAGLGVSAQSCDGSTESPIGEPGALGVDPLDPTGNPDAAMDSGAGLATVLGRFGVFAGVRYADRPTEGRMRHRASVQHLDEAVSALRFLEPEFTVVLGDLIDGQGAEEAMARVGAVLAKLPGPVECILGDRDLVLPVAELANTLAETLAEGESTGLRHRAWSGLGWRFVVLDTLDVSILGRQAGEPEHSIARAYLLTHPQPEFTEIQPDSGAVGDQQLAWLREQLVAAEQAGELVCVFSHHPLVAQVAGPGERCWNGEEVAAVLRASTAVVACLSGHGLDGQVAVVDGVNYVAMPAMVAASDPTWATVDVYPDRLEVRGRGDVTSHSLRREAVEPSNR